MEYAGPPHMSRVGAPMSLRTHPTAALSTLLSSSANEAAARPLPWSVAGTRARPSPLAPRTSSSTRDPHRACRAHVDQLLELLGEQVDLAQAIRAALRLASLKAENRSGGLAGGSRHEQQRASSPLSVSVPALHNTENVPPPLKRSLPKASGSSAAVVSLPPSSSTSAEVSVAQLANRLRVLHEEAARFATSRCLPSLAELLSTFDAYWAWKAAHDESSDANAPPQLQSDAGHRDSQHPQHSQRPPTSLRQRYEQVLRVRDELSSFLQLHADAVRALDVQLMHWQHHQAASSVAVHGQEQRGERRHMRGGAEQDKDQGREFESYICQVVDVAQATRHVAQLLQTALQALCSPAPRTASGRTLPEQDRLRRRDGVNATAGASSAASKRNDDTKVGAVEAVAAPPPPASRADSSPHSPSMCATARTPSPVATHVRSPLLHDDNGSRDGSSVWADAVSPLTPPPPTSQPTTTTAAAQARTAAETPASPPPRPVEVQRDRGDRWHRRVSRRGHSDGSHGRNGESPSQRAASPDTFNVTETGVSPSMSTTAAVSVSPLTVQRQPATAAPLASRELSEERVSQHVLSSTPAPLDVTAAVSPAVDFCARPLLEEADPGATQRAAWHRSLSNGVRSLLGDLTSADADCAPTAVLESGTAAVFVPPVPQQYTQQQHEQQQSRRSSEAQLAERSVRASTSESPSPSPAMPSQERSPPLQSASPLPTRTQPGFERSGSAAASSDGLEGGVSVGRAASVPPVLWPRLSHAGQEPPDLAEVHTAVTAATAVSSSSSTVDALPLSTATTTSTREVNPGFYTARVCAREASASQQMTGSPTMRSSTGHVWEKTFSPTPLELDQMEAELGETQQRLRMDSTAATSRSRPSRAAAADTASLASLEVSLHDAVQAELNALRAEQRHTLQRMHEDLRHTLAEVASAAASVVASRSPSSHSRASSRARSEGTQTEERDPVPHVTVPRADEEDAAERGATVRARGRAVVKTTTRTPPPPAALPLASPAAPAPTAPPVAPSAAALQEQLAAAEARAARLEQQALTLKKRIWVAEMVGAAVEGRRSSSDDGGAVQQSQQPRRRRRPLSLRDAFVYGQLGGATDAEDAGDAEVDLADDAGVEAEEAAIAYLVDRQLGWREARRSRSGDPQLRGRGAQGGARGAHPVPEEPQCRTTASGIRCGGVPREGSPDAKYFDDDGSRIGLALQHTSSATAPTRSPLIRQKRASIFQILRQGPPASATSTSAASSEVPVTTTASMTALTPPPPLRPLPDARRAERAGKASAPPIHADAMTSDGAETATESDEQRHHPYGTAAATATAPVGAHPASSSGAAPSASSQYYAAISGHGNGHGARGGPASYTHPHVHRSGDGSQSPASTWSSLRAAQVLENARRLLQNRHAAIGSAHWGGAPSRDGADTRGAQRVNERVGFQPRDAEAMPDHAAASPPPGQWGEHVELPDGTSPLPRGVSADVADQRRRAAARQSPAREHVRHDGDGPAPRGESITRRGRYRDAESPESVYHGYDTSPCAAVAYSTSKLPRSSSGADASAVSPPARPRGEARTPPRHRRVDSATSPITRTKDFRKRSVRGNVTDSPSSSSSSSSSSGEGEGEGSAESARGSRQRRRSRSTNAFSRTDSASSRQAEADTRRTQRFRSPSSSSPEALRGGGKDGFHVPHPHRHSEHRELDDVTDHEATSSRSTRRRSASLASSRASAEQQLTDALTDQASTLHAALQQLRDQQRQLREKHAQVRQAVERADSTRASATTPALVHRDRSGVRGAGEAPDTAARRGRRGKQFHKASRSGEEEEDGSGTSSGNDGHGAPAAELHRLLERFAAAESTLAEREQRIRDALHVVQRQQDALRRDDLL